MHPIQLLGPTQVRQLATELGLKPTKQRGQNFVIDPNTVRRIVQAAGLSATDIVLEVGPGLGSLTLALLEQTEQVLAVEIDRLLATQLPKTLAEFAPGMLPTVICADALQLTELPQDPTALVANLPYNVSVPVLLHLLQTFPSIRHGLVMVQAEVADRISAQPGSKIYGVPSVKAAWYGEFRRAGSIGRKVFWPEPNVDSGLVSWQAHPAPQTKATQSQVFDLIDAAFGQRRKTLRAALRSHLVDPSATLLAAGIDPQARGETLVLADFIRIAEAKLQQEGGRG